LAQAELAHGHVEQRCQVEQGNEFVEAALVVGGGHFIDVAQQVEGFDDGQVPPQLGALAKDYANMGNVFDAVFPGGAAQDLAVARVGHQDAGEHFDGGGFAGAVGADITDEFAFCHGKGDAVEGVDGAVATLDDAA